MRQPPRWGGWTSHHLAHGLLHWFNFRIHAPQLKPGRGNGQSGRHAQLGGPCIRRLWVMPGQSAFVNPTIPPRGISFQSGGPPPRAAPCRHLAQAYHRFPCLLYRQFPNRRIVRVPVEPISGATRGFGNPRDSRLGSLRYEKGRLVPADAPRNRSRARIG
jgi:hypothetical protein